MSVTTADRPLCRVVDLAARRAHSDQAAAALARWATAPVRYLPETFLLATEGLFPGFSVPELRLLRALP